MQKAVEALDAFIQSKTNHSTESIEDKMHALCSNYAWYKVFTTVDAHTAFANRCANFSKYCRTTGKKSWGRKQFELWWNEEGESQFENKVFPEASLQEDALPADLFRPFQNVQNSDVVSTTADTQLFTDSSVANAYIAGLEADNERLRKENEVLRYAVLRIHNIISDAALNS